MCTVKTLPENTVNFKANKAKQYYISAPGLKIGDMVGIKRRQKLKDNLIDMPYVAIEKPSVTIPVY